MASYLYAELLTNQTCPWNEMGKDQSIKMGMHLEYMRGKQANNAHAHWKGKNKANVHAFLTLRKGKPIKYRRT